MKNSSTASPQEVDGAIALDGRSVSALWLPAPDARAVAVLAHGANNDVRHAFLRGVAESLASERISVLRFNFPYAEDGRRHPDRPPILLETWRKALEEARRRAEGRLVFAGGKSMGGRIASMLVAEGPEDARVAGLMFFGYPLHPPGRPAQRRDSHLFSIRIPMLFLQGTADPLARFDLIQDVVGRLGHLAELHVVDGGDHSFRVKGSRRGAEETGRDLGRAGASFADRILEAAAGARRGGARAPS